MRIGLVNKNKVFLLEVGFGMRNDVVWFDFIMMVYLKAS